MDEFSWLNTASTTESYEKLDMRYEYTVDQRQGLRLEVIGYNLAGDFADYRPYNIQQKSILLRLSGSF